MFCTKISFDTLETWFYKSLYDYLLLYVSDFQGRDEELVPHLINNRSIFNTVTGNHICFIHFLPNHYFSQKARFIYMKDSEDNPAEYNYIPEDADFFSEEDYRKNGGMDISATFEASNEICNYFGIPHIDLPAFVMIPRKNFVTGYILHIHYPLNSVADIDKFFNALSLIRGYEEDRKRATERPRQLEQEIKSAEEKLSRLNKVISDISERISIQRTRVPEKEILSVLSGFVQMQPDTPLSPRGLKALLKEQGRLVDFFASKSARECYNNFRQEYCKLDDLRTELTQNQLAKNKLNHQLEIITQHGGPQQALKLAREEAEKQQKHLDSDFLNTLQRRYLLTEVQSQKLCDELNSPEWISFESFKVLTYNIYDKITVIGNEVAALEAKIERHAFDTFISCSSKDYASAEKLKEYLERKGLKPFLAKVSLREIGSSLYGSVIRKVLESCRYFVLFATCNEYITNSYVYHEWNAYIEDEYRGRHQDGKLVPVIKDVRTGDQLHLALRNRQMFSTDSYEEDGLVEFLTNGVDSERD